MTANFLYRYIGNILILQDDTQREYKIHTNLYHPALTCHNSTLYISGGQTLSTLSPYIYSLDLTQNFSTLKFPESFNLIGNMIFLRFHHTITFYNNTLYILGGNDNHNIGNFSEKFKLNDSSTETIPPISEPSMLHSATLNCKKIYVVGGVNNQNKYNEKIYVFDLLLEKWTSRTLKLILTTRPVVIPFCCKGLIVVGGWNKDCKFNNKVVVVDTEAWKEKVLKHFFIGEYFHSFIVKNGILSLMDHTGLVHRKSLGLLKKNAEFKLWKKRLWVRRKAFIYFLAYNKDLKYNFSLNIAREICKFI